MDCNNCDKGIKMCYNRPGFGTPEEFEAIIDAGYAHKLRIDYWVGRKPISEEQFKSLPDFLQEYYLSQHNPFIDDVLMLSGATDHDENYHSSFSPRGKCHLLEDDKCVLHDKGLKPEQCREACCDDEINEAKENLYYATIWNTENGIRVIEKFKKAVGI